MAPPHDGIDRRPPQPASFESLLGEILPAAYRVACSLTGNATDAEDLVQEAALLAFRAFASFVPGSDFKAWFFKILTHRHFERHRRSTRRPVTVAYDEIPDLFLFSHTAEAGLHASCDDPARLVMSQMTAAQVMQAIAALSDELRGVATLYFVDDMSYPEMAEILGCPPGTVRSRLHRARRVLQRELWAIAVESGIIRELSSREITA